MRRPVAVLTAVVALAGCGSSGDGGGSTTAATTAAGKAAKAAPTPRQAAAGQPTPAERGGHVKKASPTARAQAARYDRAFSDLPYGTGRLPVAQTIVSEDQPGLLVARLSPRKFFCLGSADQRAAAIRDYYRQAARRVRRTGLKTLRLVVAPLSDTAEVTLVWGRASGGRVQLTRAGRTGRCARP